MNCWLTVNEGPCVTLTALKPVEGEVEGACNGGKRMKGLGRLIGEGSGLVLMERARQR